MPVRNAYRRFNTYLYQSIAPVSHDPEELDALGKKAGENLGKAMGDQLERWRTQSLPGARVDVCHLRVLRPRRRRA